MHKWLIAYFPQTSLKDRNAGFYVVSHHSDSDGEYIDTLSGPHKNTADAETALLDLAEKRAVEMETTQKKPRKRTKADELFGD